MRKSGIWRLLGLESDPTPPEPAQVRSEAMPAPHRHTSLDAWLRAWIAWRLVQGAPYPRHLCSGPFGEGLVLGGSIGLLYAFAPDGTVWIQSELAGPGGEPPEAWRQATSNQRLAILIGAQRHHFPELAVLLPLRPQQAVDCAACAGGQYENFWCGACSNRGWTLAGIDTSLPPLM